MGPDTFPRPRFPLAPPAPTGAAPSSPSPPLDYDSYLTKRSLARKPSPIRALMPLLSIPGMISLGGGMPNEGLFPVSVSGSAAVR